MSITEAAGLVSPRPLVDPATINNRENLFSFMQGAIDHWKVSIS
jgi:hypothetical protein